MVLPPLGASSLALCCLPSLGPSLPCGAHSQALAQRVVCPRPCWVQCRRLPAPPPPAGCQDGHFHAPDLVLHRSSRPSPSFTPASSLLAFSPMASAAVSVTSAGGWETWEPKLPRGRGSRPSRAYSLPPHQVHFAGTSWEDGTSLSLSSPTP